VSHAFQINQTAVNFLHDFDSGANHARQKLNNGAGFAQHHPVQFKKKTSICNYWGDEASPLRAWVGK